MKKTNKYKCNKCGAIKEIESNKKWLSSMCEGTLNARFYKITNK